MEICPGPILRAKVAMGIMTREAGWIIVGPDKDDS
jgi:hypothetical protein